MDMVSFLFSTMMCLVLILALRFSSTNRMNVSSQGLSFEEMADLPSCNLSETIHNI